MTMFKSTVLFSLFFIFSSNTSEKEMGQLAELVEAYKPFKQHGDSFNKKKKSVIDSAISSPTDFLPLIKQVYSEWTGIDRRGFVSMLIGATLFNSDEIYDRFGLDCLLDIRKNKDAIKSCLSYWKDLLKRGESDIDFLDTLTVWKQYGSKSKLLKSKGISFSFLTHRGTEISQESLQKNKYDRSKSPSDYEEINISNAVEEFATNPHYQKLFIINKGGFCFPFVVIQKNNIREYYYANIIDNVDLVAHESPLNIIDKQSISFLGTIAAIEKTITSLQNSAAFLDQADSL